MKLHQLRSAVAIVNNDFNLTRAAKSLTATQPGVSAHVRLLEQELGVTLFVRDRKRFIGLTPAGATLLPMAARLVEGANEFHAEARRIASPAEHELTVACGPTPAHLLPDILQELMHRYPRIRVRVKCGSIAMVLDDTIKGEADICILSESAEFPSSIDFQPCYTLGWSLLGKPEHPLMIVPELTLAAIARYPIITYDGGFASRAHIVEAFATAGLALNIALSVGDADAMKRSVRAGIGVAILRSDNLIPEEEPGLLARSLNHLIQRSTIFAGVRRDHQQSAPLRHLVKLMQSPKARPSDRHDLPPASLDVPASPA